MCVCVCVRVARGLLGDQLCELVFGEFGDDRGAGDARSLALVSLYGPEQIQRVVHDHSRLVHNVARHSCGDHSMPLDSHRLSSTLRQVSSANLDCKPPNCSFICVCYHP